MRNLKAGDTGALEQEQCSALAANAAAQAALWSTSGTSKLTHPDTLNPGGTTLSFHTESSWPGSKQIM